MSEEKKPITMGDLVPKSKATELDDHEECELCLTHIVAEKQLPNQVICPSCHYPIEDSEHSINDWEVVGEVNGYEPDTLIGKYPVYFCTNCESFIAMMPHKIMYNANHDVYITGGRQFLVDGFENEIFERAEKKILEHLNQWVSRVAAGERLDPSYPAIWMRRDVTEAIAEYMYEKGLKK